MGLQGDQVAKTILKKNEAGGTHTPPLAGNWHKDRYLGQWNKTEGPETSPDMQDQMLSHKGAKTMPWGKGQSSTNDNWKTGYPHAKK